MKTTLTLFLRQLWTFVYPFKQGEPILLFYSRSMIFIGVFLELFLMAIFIPLVMILDAHIVSSALLLPTIIGEVLIGGLFIRLSYTLNKKKFVFLLNDKEIEKIPFGTAVSIFWSCTWRFWWIKFMMMVCAILLFLLSDTLFLTNTMVWGNSEMFNKILFGYDMKFNILAVFAFFPVIHKINSAYKLLRRSHAA